MSSRQDPPDGRDAGRDAAASGAGAETLDGARLFQRCYSSHSLNSAEQNLTDPALGGLFDRRAGTLTATITRRRCERPARRGLVWGEESLDRFLEDPEELVPGTRMAGVWPRDPEERRTLIQWLRDAAR